MSGSTSTLSNPTRPSTDRAVSIGSAKAASPPVSGTGSDSSNNVNQIDSPEEEAIGSLDGRDEGDGEASPDEPEEEETEEEEDEDEDDEDEDDDDDDGMELQPTSLHISALDLAGYG